MDGRKIGGPHIRIINIVSMVFSVLLLLLFVLASSLAERARNDLKAAVDRFVESEMAATALKQGSDNLTTQVRLYTVTADPDYLRGYFDEVASGNREEAVDTLERCLSGTDAHRLLESALESSMKLMELEYRAMALVLDAAGGVPGDGMEALGRVTLSGEETALSAAEKLARAVSLTHGREYQRYDDAIDADVRLCIESLHRERETAQEENLRLLTRAETRQRVLAVLLVAVVLLRTLLTSAYIIRPIEEDVKLLAADRPLPPRGAYELRYLAVAYNDMYEQRRQHDTLVAERMQALELLERERTSLSIVHQTMHSGMWSMDFDGRGEMTAVSWSDEFRHMVGYRDTNDFPDTLEAWSDLLHEEDRERVLREYYDTLHDYTGQKTYDVEYRLLTRDQGWRWFHAAGRPSRREDGSPVRYIGLFVDITDKKELERKLDEQRAQLQQALREAQAANRAKNAFLMNMSHDVRTPMNAILGCTELAEKHLRDPDAVRGYLEKISVSGAHLLSLIDEVLEMSRIENGHAAPQEAPCSLPALLGDVAAMVAAEAEAKSLTFTSDASGVTDRTVLCDRSMLTRVLLNIAGNAVKFTPAHGSIRLLVRETDPPSADGFARYAFTVRDTGIGMSPAFQQHFFEAFARERSSTVSGVEGLGLGMTVAKNLVDLMGGAISLQSEEGRGTEVTVTLPLRPADAAAEAPDAGMAARDLTGTRILLVEDNAINQEIARELLEEAGCAVDVAEDGSAAVERVRSAAPGQYDLILMDIQMPVMDGYEATRRIRALDSPLAAVPILALSANNLESDRRSSRESGMNAHLGKPYEPAALLREIARHIPPRRDGEPS